MSRKYVDLKGKRFGRLLVLDRNGIAKNGNIQWLCQCDCGNQTIVDSQSLKRNFTKSCGCLRKELVTKNKTKHGMYGTRLNYIWNSMKQRCINSNNDAYKYYGARGIKVCDEWLNDFMNFYNWAINSGYQDNLTLDRINVNGNYEPNNCRWATMKEQSNNTRVNHLIKFNKETHTIAEWSEILNINKSILYDRINRSNMTIEEALTKKVRRKNENYN